MSMHIAELVRNATGRRPGVFPFVWLWPRASGGFNYTVGLKGAELAAAVEVPAAMGADGVILWGSSEGEVLVLTFLTVIRLRNVTVSAGVDSHSVVNASTRNITNAVLCDNIREYLVTVAGPVMVECVAERQKCSASKCSGHGRCATPFNDGDAVGVCKKWEEGQGAAASACVCGAGWTGEDCATNSTHFQ
jgi:hypothetical protein